MYLFFTTNGAIDNILTNTTGQTWVQGNLNANTIYAYFDGKLNTSYVAYVQFKRPDGQISPELIMSPFTFSTPTADYNGYKFTINDEWILAKYGTLEITIRLRDASNTTIVSGIFFKDVQQSVYDEDPNITITQYTELMNAISEILLINNNIDNVVVLNSGATAIEKLIFDTDGTAVLSNAGEVGWDEVDGTFDFQILNDLKLHLGQQLLLYGRVLPTAQGGVQIDAGDVVQFGGAQGDQIILKKAKATEINVNPHLIIGVAPKTIPAGEFGYVVAFGKVKGINTTNFSLGALLWFNSSDLVNDGKLTATQPVAPFAKILVGAVLRSANDGVILVRPTWEPKLDELQNVNTTGVGNGNVLVYNNGVWVVSTSLTDLNSTTSSHINNISNPHSVTKAQVGLSDVDNVQQIPLSQKGVANGVATLDSQGKLSFTQIPSLANDVIQIINSTIYADVASLPTATSTYYAGGNYDRPRAIVIHNFGSPTQWTGKLYKVEFSGPPTNTYSWTTDDELLTLGKIYLDISTETTYRFTGFIGYSLITTDHLSITNATILDGKANLVNGKIPLSELPNAVFDSLHFFSSVSGNIGTGFTLSAITKSVIDNANLTNRSPKGYYYVASSTGQVNPNPTIANSVGGVYILTRFSANDDGGYFSSDNVIYESGDWFVLTNLTGTGVQADPYIATWAFVENTYELATTLNDGVVRLSNSGSTATTGDNVITDGILNGLVGDTSTKLGRGDYAKAGYDHSIATGNPHGTNATQINTLLNDAYVATDTYPVSDVLNTFNTALETIDNGHATLTGGKVPIAELPNEIDDVLVVWNDLIFTSTTDLTNVLNGSTNSWDRRFLVRKDDYRLDVYFLPKLLNGGVIGNYTLEKTIGRFSAYQIEFIFVNSPTSSEHRNLYIISGNPFETSGILNGGSVSNNTGFTLILGYDHRQLVYGLPYDSTLYRVASDGNSFNPSDNTKAFYAGVRKIEVGGTIWRGSIFHFTNNFFQYEDFVITRNGTFDITLNRDNTTWFAIGTTIFQPAGSSNWETSESGNHKIWIIILDPNTNTANTNRIVIFEKIN